MQRMKQTPGLREARATTNASGVVNAGYIKEVDIGNTQLDLLQNLESLNANEASVLSSINIFLDNTVAPKFFTFEWRSLQGNSRLLLEGCIPTSAEITLDAKAQPTISFTFTTNSATASSEVSALSAIAYAAPVIPCATGANAARMLRGSTALAVSGLSIAIEQTLAPALNHNIAQGVGAMLCTGRTVTASFTELITSSLAPITATSGTSTDPLFLQLGGTGGNIFTMCIPNPQMLSVGELNDNDGVVGQAMTYGPLSYSGDTTTAGAPSTDPSNSAFRVSFL